MTNLYIHSYPDALSVKQLLEILNIGKTPHTDFYKAERLKVLKLVRYIRYPKNV